MYRRCFFLVANSEVRYRDSIGVEFVGGFVARSAILDCVVLLFLFLLEKLAILEWIRLFERHPRVVEKL